MNYTNYRNTLDNELNYYAPEDIVNFLCKLADCDRDTKYCNQIKDDLTDAVYDLKAIADNQYNSDYHRELYFILLTIARRLDEGYITIDT